MPRRSRALRSRAATTPDSAASAEAQSVAVTERTDRLVELADQCSAAKHIADEIGETFLSYLLAMVIQESRLAMRRATKARVIASPPPPKKKAPKVAD